MKRAILVLAVLFGVCLPFCFGQFLNQKPTAVTLAGPWWPWSEIGTITSSQAYPAVGARGYDDVEALADAKTFVWTVPNLARKAQMSFQTTADADSTTIVLMGFADSVMYDTTGSTEDDDAIYLGQLVLTGGKQVGSHSNVYVDTIVATDGLAVFAVSDSATDRRCVVTFQTNGLKYIYGIATTLQADSTLYALGRFYQ